MGHTEKKTEKQIMTWTQMELVYLNLYPGCNSDIERLKLGES